MAAAEARAAWQRTANRCFVQEDAKRAPRLACCPSSSSKLQSDASSDDAYNGSDNCSTTFMPFNLNPSYSNLPPDTKWWLQLQPNFVYPKDLTHEQLNALDAKLEGKAEDVNGGALPSEDSKNDLDDCLNLESPWMVSATCLKHDCEARVQELKAVNTNMQQTCKHKAEVGDYWCSYEDFMKFRHVGPLNEKKDTDDFEMPWVEGEKTEPWWRTSDRNELASLVAQKSSEHIENCDLPPPQTMHLGKGACACLDSSPSSEKFSRTDICNRVGNVQHSPSGSMDGKCWPSSELQHTVYDSDRSCSGPKSYTTTIKDSVESRYSSESIPSKAQLLEALRHSQTRAREAEKAAEQANTEKEHIIKLFFRQASHLFACKQWLHLLQLETLLLQLKAKDNQNMHTFFPGLPWKPLNVKKLRKGVHRVIRRNRNGQNCGICKYAAVVAIGLGLGAGLLLGWTVGWLMPCF